MNTPNGGDFRTGTITGPARQFPAKNTEDESIPPFSVVEIIDADRPASLRAYADIAKPSGDTDKQFAFTGPMSILAQDRNNLNQGYGSVSQDYPLWAAYDDTEGTPQPGDVYTVDQNSWVIHPGGNEFVIIGAPVTDETPPRVLINRIPHDSSDAIPGGDCDCCPECVCLPDAENLITSCAAIPCLVDTYSVVGKFPFTNSEPHMAHSSGCVYYSDPFSVSICGTDYGTQRWKLTVGGDVHDSKLELIPYGSTATALPLVYYGKWYFDATCGNTFGIKKDCSMPQELFNLFPKNICVNAYVAGSTDDCKNCGGGGTISSPCCASPMPSSLLLTLTDDGTDCAGLNGQTVALAYRTDMTLSGAGRWYGSATICGVLWEFVIGCCYGEFKMAWATAGSVCGGNASYPSGTLLTYAQANLNYLECEFASWVSPDPGSTCSPVNLVYAGASSGLTCPCCSGPAGRPWHATIT